MTTNLSLYKIFLKRKRKEDKKQLFLKKRLNFGLEVVSFALELGFIIAIPIVLGALIGKWLDNKFLTRPKFTLSLIFLGTFLGISNLLFFIRKVTNKN